MTDNASNMISAMNIGFPSWETFHLTSSNLESSSGDGGAADFPQPADSSLSVHLLAGEHEITKEAVDDEGILSQT